MVRTILLIVICAFGGVGCKTLNAPVSAELSDEYGPEDIVESYDQRPKIEDVPEQGLAPRVADRLHRDHGFTFTNYTEALIESAAQFWGHVLALPNEHHAYLMGRDAALMYDVIVHFGKELYPEDLHRVHLLNISQESVSDPNLVKYLPKHDLSKEAFQRGRVAHFWDTGWRGVTLGKVMDLFPEYRDRFFINFAGSQNKGQADIIPSSRLFFSLVYPELEAIAPHSYRERLAAIERFPRFMNRATNYVALENGSYEACVVADKAWKEALRPENKGKYPFRASWDSKQSWEGLPQRDKLSFLREYQAVAAQRNNLATSVMGALRRRMSQEEYNLQNRFEQRMFLHMEISEVIQSGNKGEIVRHFQKLLNENPEDFVIEAIVRDAVEKIERHYKDISEIDRVAELRLRKGFKRKGSRIPASVGSPAGPNSSTPALPTAPEQPATGGTPELSQAEQDARYTRLFRNLVDADRVISRTVARDTVPEERLAAMRWLLANYTRSEAVDAAMVSGLSDPSAEVRLRAVEYVAQHGTYSDRVYNQMATQLRRPELLLDKEAVAVTVRALESAKASALITIYEHYALSYETRELPPKHRGAIEWLLSIEIMKSIADVCRTQGRIIKEK